MAAPDRGEVWVVDLGMAGKVRPCLGGLNRPWRGIEIEADAIPRNRTELISVKAK